MKSDYKCQVKNLLVGNGKFGISINQVGRSNSDYSKTRNKIPGAGYSVLRHLAKANYFLAARKLRNDSFKEQTTTGSL